MSSLKLLAPAKINLFLKILGRRADGYHDLSMLMEKISLSDAIVLEKIPSGIELADPIEGVPTEKNLVYQAALALKKVSDTYEAEKGRRCRTPTGQKGVVGVGHLWEGVRITLIKKIPMGGGLGGGSSDAAAVLKGLNVLWNLNWPVEKLSAIGVKLGADVPFFLYNGPAQVAGIGEQIVPLKNFPKLSIILINPGIPVDTAWAYQQWDLNELTQENPSVSVPRTFDFEGILSRLHNDFEAVVFPKFPEIKEAKEKLLEGGAAGALMSGSGSTVFGLFETEEKRDRALESLKIKPNWRVLVAGNNWGVDKR